MKTSERINLFNSIRDVPFCIMGKKAAYCFSKNKQLKNSLESIGIKSKMMQGWFKWSELNIPEKIKSLIVTDRQKHVFLEVYIPEKNKWVYIDPTWDIHLKSFFPIAQWDGINETILMTKLTGISEYKKTSILYRVVNKVKRKLNFKNNNDFYHALDGCMNEIRLANL